MRGVCFLAVFLALAAGFLAPLRQEKLRKHLINRQVSSAISSASRGCSVPLKVETANVLLGARLDALLNVQKKRQLPEALVQELQRIIGLSLNGLDPARRLAAIAQHIVEEGVQIAGLQEVALFKIGPQTVDFLAILEQLLNTYAGGVYTYSAVAVRQGFSLTLPLPAGVAGPEAVEASFAIRDVIFARNDVTVSNVQSAGYENVVVIPEQLFGVPVPRARSWISVDAIAPGALEPVRFVSTHLESGSSEGTVAIRRAQATELANLVKEWHSAQPSLPIIVVGDFNSQFSTTGGAADIIIGSDTGLRDAWTSRDGPGLTYGHDELLTLDQFSVRIDYVTGNGRVTFGRPVTVDLPVVPAEGAQFPLFASDHKFVMVTANVPSGYWKKK